MSRGETGSRIVAETSFVRGSTRVTVSAYQSAAQALAGTAIAAGPVRSDAVFDFPDPEVYTECDGYDVVLSDMHIERHSLTWYDGETPVLERRHASFSGTFTNSVTDKTGAFSGHLGLESDFASGRLTLTGLLRQVKAPGKPAASRDGRRRQRRQRGFALPGRPADR